MALETELKMRVADHAMVRLAMKSAGATFVKHELEINTFLDSPDNRLLRDGSGLRVRSATNLESGQVNVIITHKGPKKAGPMKIREETELRVASYDDAVKLLGQLGYEVKLSFQKRRETWNFDDCEVVLDELPELGRFVEIEGPDVSAVNAARAKLGLGHLTVEPEGYAVLVSSLLRSAGRTTLQFP